MLWDRINQYKEPVSVTFCILFSFTSLFWNGNLFVRGVASSKALSDTVSASIDSVGDLLKSSYKKLESFETVRKERDFYQKIAEEYKLLPQDLEKLKNENDALRKELGFSPKIDYPTVKSEILSVRLNSIYRTIIIDKGSDSGIKPYMPVIGRAIDEKGQVLQALVGKVIAVSGSSSVVQPLINSNFTMGIRLPGTNLWASLSGNSGRGTEAILSFIDNGIIIDPRVFSTFQPGPNPLSTDTLSTASLSKLGKGVFTSGGSGIFPAGIPVGVITEEGARTGSFKTAYLRPYIKFEELQFVTVLKKLPDKWTETWPEEKSISIENPYFGELNFPGEEKENKQEKDKDKNKSKEKTKGPETKNNSKEPKKTGNDSVKKPGTEDIDDTLPKQPGAEE